MLNAVASGSGTMSGGLIDEADANHSASPYVEGSRVLVPQGKSTYEAKVSAAAQKTLGIASPASLDIVN